MNLDGPASARALPAGAGLAWLAQSLALIRAQPGRLLLLAVLLQAILGLSQVPLLGIFIVLAVPAFTAGLLEGFHFAASGQRPPAAVLFAGLASSPRTGRLLMLGTLIFLAGIACASLAFGIDGATIDTDLIARIEQGDVEALAALDPVFLSRVAMALAVAVAVSGTLSFLAVPLIWFSRMRTGAAVLAGLRAMVVNWKPFLVLGLGLAALLLPVAALTGLLFGAGGLSPGMMMLSLLLVLLALLLFQLVVFGTQYCAHRAIFGAGDSPPAVPPPQGDDGQFVA